MNKKTFQKLQEFFSKSRVNLWLGAIFFTYLIIIAVSLINSNVCENIGVDYCAYWGAGKIIRQHGFGAVYQIDFLKKIQSEIYFQGEIFPPDFTPIEIPYLPIFLLPFPILSLIPSPTSYYLWIILNLAVLILYLLFYINKIGNVASPYKVLILLALSLPMMINLQEGQLNAFLLICVGEFVRQLDRQSFLKAGLWLGGLLLKPQLLILILPFLLLSRSFKILKGFTVSSFFIFLASFVLIGKRGFINLLNILLDSSAGGVASTPVAMINWRSLGLFINTLTSSTAGWVVIIIGSLFTTGIAFYLFRKTDFKEMPLFSIPLLGIFTATLLVTWHAYLHMSIILYPIMIYLIIKKQMNFTFLYVWFFFPIVVKILSTFVATFIIKFDWATISFIYGVRFFNLNIFLLIWSFIVYSEKEKELLQDSIIEISLNNE
jgi:hypothetical protein